jgi:hypothetical protein
MVIGNLKKSKVLNSGVSASGKNDERLLATVFQQREKNEKLLVMVFQQQKGKGETIAGRSCFIDEGW